MKYHISIKFLAVLLCAASLLALAGGIGGVIGLEALGLYDQSVEDMYAQQLEEQGSGFARSLVQQYVSEASGHCPEQVAKEYFGLWHLESVLRQDRLQFVITDPAGEEVSGNLPDSGWRGQTMDFTIRGVPWLKLEESHPLEDDMAAQVPDAPEGKITWDHYDEALRQNCRLYLSLQGGAETYQVKLYMEPDILGAEGSWELLKIIWPWRRELPTLAIIGALVFAVSFVYLCCAAGHKKGREEISAGGLNRLPLDLYGFIVLCAGGLAVFPGLEILYYLLEGNLQAAILVGGFLAGGVSLLVVGFLFAFAAQVKMPRYFWITNSLCGWSCRLGLWLWGRVVALIRWVWSWAWPLTVRAFRALWKLAGFFWNEAGKLLKKSFSLLAALCRWCGRKTVRFIGMLPLVWQWLAGAFVMILVLALTVSSRSAGVVVLGIGLVLALVLYGATAFGSLLESARQMRQGDLNTKVDESFLVGAFREFAQELNGLADVAVVAAQRQLKSERMKTELITNVSHDIKTPLTSIINFVDLMQKPHSQQEQEQYLEVLSRQSQRLKKLIDDLMEMSKASTGNLTVDIQRIDAAEAVNQALGEFADKLERSSLTPVFHQPEEPVFIQADGRLFWRVMSNLLSNAVKYALPGTRVYLDVSRLGDKVVISMKNISREELNVEADELMERFVRGDASRNTEGSGLGLNIARSLMQLQKGELQILVDGDLFKVTLVFPGCS